jgi:hypothetical protein
VQWNKVFDTGKDDLGFCVRQTSDGGYIISGFHDAAPMSPFAYILLIKTDAAGTIQWDKRYQFAARDLNHARSVRLLPRDRQSNGGYIIAGTIIGSHPADVDVLRTDASGNIVWAKSYEHDASIFRVSTGGDVIETSTGDFRDCRKHG